MSKQGLSQEQIDRKKERIVSWREELNKQSEKHFDLLDVKSKLNHDNLLDMVNDKIALAMNSIEICKYQIRILDSQLMVDKFRKENYKIKTNM